jgi:hypothetical protein
VDVDVQLLGSRGQTRSKIFKGRRCDLESGAEASLRLRLPIRSVTVRTYYPGRQSCALIVNGQRSSVKHFTLTLP